MSEGKKIRLEKNGNILSLDMGGQAFSVDTTDANAILARLNELDDAHLDVLAQVTEKEKNTVGDLFSTLLTGMISQKNIVKGKISNVKGNVIIGDNNSRIYNYFLLQPSKTSKELTLRLPKILKSEIIGRGKDVEGIKKILFDNQQVVVVNGMGGIGKTTLAQVYVSEYYRDYRHIAWISLTTGEVENDFITTEGLLERFNVKKEDKTPRQLFVELIMALKELQGPNLLVIDNADSRLGKYYSELPRAPHWHVLATSREKIENFKPKELGFLEEAEAITLFKKWYTRGQLSDEFLKTLVKEVEYHTLTIEILAKTAQAQRTSPEKLTTAIEDDLKASGETRHSQKKIERITTYLCSIFNVSRLDEDEQWTLRQMVCLPPEFHAYEKLEALIQPAQYEKDSTFAEALHNLAEKGWLLYTTDTDSYKMHRIISEVIQRTLTIEEQHVHRLINSISSLLSLDQTKDNPIDKFQWLVYGKEIVKKFNASEPETIAVLQNNLGLRLKEFGDYEGAKELLEKAMKSAEKNFGPEHPTTATRYSNLALLLKDLGEYQGAKELLEKAMRSDQKNFGFEHPTTAISYSNLAGVLQDLGEYQGAKELLEKAVKSAEKNFGFEHPATAIHYSNLAGVLKDLGEYQRAMKLLEKAMKLDEKNFGFEHPATARSYSNLAMVLQDLGEYEGAKELLEKAMKSVEKNFGPEHPTTATFYSNLATVLKNLGEYQSAKELLEKAMKSDEKNFGFEHPSTARSYSNLAGILKGLGEYQGAKELLEKAMKSDEKNFGFEHPTTARSYSNLATVLKDLGEYQGAKELLEKAIKLDEKNFGFEHPTTAISYFNLAGVLQDLGECQRAKELFEKAMKSNEKNFGFEHPTTAISYSNLALVLQDLEEYQRAKELFEKAMKSNEKNFGFEHPTTAISYSNLAGVLQDLGEYQGAKELFEKAMKSVEKNFGPEHLSTAIRYSNLALVLQDLGEYQRAKELLEKAVKVFEKKLGTGHPNTKLLQSNLEYVISIIKK